MPGATALPDFQEPGVDGVPPPAAHSGCFSMALSAQLGELGLTADKINTTATVKLEKLETGFTVTEIHLDVTAAIPNATEDQFKSAAFRRRVGGNADETCKHRRDRIGKCTAV